MALTKLTSIDCDVDLMDPICRGTFGTYYKGRDKETNTTYSVKKIENKDGIDTSGELKVLFKMKPHTNIITMHTFEYLDQDLWIVYEHCELSELETYYKTNKINFDTKFNIAKQLLQAVDFIHANKPHPILHGDISPAHILPFFDKNGDIVIKLSGFARSRKFTGPISIANASLNDYSAPECYAKEEWTLAVDMFAVGIVMLAMLLNPGKSGPLRPLSETAIEEDFQMPPGSEMLMNKRRGLPPSNIISVPSELVNPLERCLRYLVRDTTKYAPDERKTALTCKNSVLRYARNHGAAGSAEATDHSTPTSSPRTQQRLSTQQSRPKSAAASNEITRRASSSSDQQVTKLSPEGKVMGSVHRGSIKKSWEKT